MHRIFLGDAAKSSPPDYRPESSFEHGDSGLKQERQAKSAKEPDLVVESVRPVDCCRLKLHTVLIRRAPPSRRLRTPRRPSTAKRAVYELILLNAWAETETIPIQKGSWRR